MGGDRCHYNINKSLALSMLNYHQKLIMLKKNTKTGKKHSAVFPNWPYYRGRITQIKQTENW